MTLPDAIERARAGKRSSIKCPAHEDRSPSLSVGPGRDVPVILHCFSGCAPENILASAGIPFADLFPEKDRRRHYITPIVRRPSAPRDDDAERTAKRTAKRFTWPAFYAPIEHGTFLEEEFAFILLSTLAELRHVSEEGLHLAADRGLLRFGKYEGEAAWIVCDAKRINAQVRRMDGKLWPGIGGKKAWTLPGSRAAWPIGAEESTPFPIVILVEGGPDLLAAHCAIYTQGREADTTAVCMIGAGLNIPGDALPLFTNKRIRIMSHTDPAGQVAGDRWAAQLESVGAEVDQADFAELQMADGTPIEDLNDCTRIRPEDAHQLSDLIPAL